MQNNNSTQSENSSGHSTQPAHGQGPMAGSPDNPTAGTGHRATADRNRATEDDSRATAHDNRATADHCTTADHHHLSRMDPVFTEPAPRHTVETAPLLNIANVLTVVRIIFIPVFAVLILKGAHGGALRWAAVAAFILLILTDYVDGWVARSRNLITDFGKIADPIADKALMITALVGLNITGDLWWWVTVVIVVRELGITVWRMVMLRRGLVVPASKGGKNKTALQALAVTMLLAPVGAHLYHLAADLVMAAAVIVTVVTGVQYLWDSRQQPTAPTPEGAAA